MWGKKSDSSSDSSKTLTPAVSTRDITEEGASPTASLQTTTTTTLATAPTSGQNTKTTSTTESAKAATTEKTDTTSTGTTPATATTATTTTETTPATTTTTAADSPPILATSAQRSKATSDLVIKTKKCDILIIGAGLSGLTSAFKIQSKEPSLQVHIIEATGRIGGQVASNSLGEIGGKWITEQQNHIVDLLQDLGVPMRRRENFAAHLKRVWDLDRGMFSSLSQQELHRYLYELEIRVHYYKPGRYTMSNDCKSMHDHLVNRLFFNKSRNFMKNFVLIVSGLNAWDISYDEFMAICYTCGGLQNLIDLYIEYPTSLWEISSYDLLQAFARKLKNVKVFYLRKALEVHQHRDRIEVYDSQFEVHEAEAVILAIPYNNLRNVFFLPPVSLSRMLRKPPIAEFPKHIITNFIIKYKKPHWRLAGFSGNLFLNTPLLIVGYEYRSTTYCGFIVHSEGFEPFLESAILETLGKEFSKEMLKPSDLYLRSFELSALVGCPLTTPSKRIIWSSSAAAATCFRGRLGGAIQSGLRAAMNALMVTRPQLVNWHDIAEFQCRSETIKRDASFLDLWTSTWNLYNVGYFSLVIVGIGAAMRLYYNS